MQVTPILGFIETYCHSQTEEEEERSHIEEGDDRGSGNIDESAGPVDEVADTSNDFESPPALAGLDSGLGVTI